MNKLTLLRRGGQVRRFHTVPVLRQQTVGEHSHALAVLVHYIYPEARCEVIRAALFHDISECVTGDTPANSKWQFPELGKASHDASESVEQAYGLRENLTDDEALLVKWCDYAELCMFCLEEWQMGNHTVREMLERVMPRLGNMLFEEDATLLNSGGRANEVLTHMQRAFKSFSLGTYDYKL